MTDVEHISRKGTGVPVSWFPVPEESELPENLRGLFKKARETVGFVPNVFRAYSFRPERLSAWFAHYRQLHEPTENLDAAEREMIAVAVSMANGCLYCLVAHGAALRQALGDPILADRITLDYRRAGDGSPENRGKDHPSVRRTGLAGLRPTFARGLILLASRGRLRMPRADRRTIRKWRDRFVSSTRGNRDLVPGALKADANAGTGRFAE